jgi:hypothetical protein
MVLGESNPRPKPNPRRTRLPDLPLVLNDGDGALLGYGTGVCEDFDVFLLLGWVVGAI